jgi:ribose 1,5-bisphosphokinase
VNGRLIYLIGASGSGKDSLLNYARQRLAGQPGLVFAHRYITRPHDVGGENHIALSKEEFAERQRSGLFAMCWDSHGYRYGIGCEINLWLAKGLTVVMNGSREYLPEARQRYPELRAVLVCVSPGVLAARLRERGREDEEEIARRVARAAAYAAPAGIHDRVDNDGTLEEAGEAFVRIILASREEASGLSQTCA